MSGDGLERPQAVLVEVDPLHEQDLGGAHDASQRAFFDRVRDDHDLGDLGREHRPCRLQQLSYRPPELGALHGPHRAGQELEVALPAPQSV